ncbi:MAG TPA: hypothetical protein VIG33_15085 [Pseudobdellovibrionaceae bacterium]|jgi:hypothetical protein
MNKLTDTQKKWALTACLTSVLSLNLVMNLANSSLISNYQSADFASESRYTREVAAELAAEAVKDPAKKPAPIEITKTATPKAAPKPETDSENTESAPTKKGSAIRPPTPEEAANDEGSSSVEAAPEKNQAESQDPNIKWVPFVSEKGERIKVQYTQENDKQTLALVPKVTQAGICYSCGKEYLLPKEFSSSASDLEAALRKAINKKAAVNNDEEKIADTSEDEDLEPQVVSRSSKINQEIGEDEEEPAPEEDKDFVALKKKCDNKEDDSRLECFANGLTKLLKDTYDNRKSKKEHRKEDVLALFKEEIQPGLISGLKDVSDLLPSRRMRTDPFADVVDTEQENRREKAQVLVENMISSISKKYNYLRQKLTAIAASVVLKSQEEAQQKLKLADQIKQTNPGQALKLQSEGYAKLRAANQSGYEIGGTLFNGLSSAQDFNYINQEQFDNLYQDNYANLVNQAIQGLTTNPLTYVIPSATLSPGSRIVDGNGQEFTLTPSTSPLVQQRLGRGISVVNNGLTATNLATQNAPRIVTLGGILQPGTATIQPFQATQAQTLQSLSAPRNGR